VRVQIEEARENVLVIAETDNLRGAHVSTAQIRANLEELSIAHDHACVRHALIADAVDQPAANKDDIARTNIVSDLGDTVKLDTATARKTATLRCLMPLLLVV